MAEHAVEGKLLADPSGEWYVLTNEPNGPSGFGQRVSDWIELMDGSTVRASTGILPGSDRGRYVLIYEIRVENTELFRNEESWRDVGRGQHSKRS